MKVKKLKNKDADFWTVFSAPNTRLECNGVALEHVVNRGNNSYWQYNDTIGGKIIDENEAMEVFEAMKDSLKGEE